MRRQLDYYLTWTEAADAGVRGRRRAALAPRVHCRVAEHPQRRSVGLQCRMTVMPPCRLVSATLWWATSRMRLEMELWRELALGLPSASDHPRPRRSWLSGAALFVQTCGATTTGTGRAVELARAEEERLGPAGEPWVEVALPQPVERRSGRRARGREPPAVAWPPTATDDDFWRLKRGPSGKALILATLIGEAAYSTAEPPPVAESGPWWQQADAFGHPSSVASASVTGSGWRCGRPSPPRRSRSSEKALDLCAPLGVERHELLGSPRVGIPLHATGRPLDALALLRAALPRDLRVGTWHVWPALAHIAPALAVAGHPRCRGHRRRLHRGQRQ